MKGSLVVFMIFVAAASLCAQSTVGTISYMEGEVHISRDGELLSGRDVGIGTDIEAFDTLETGADGYAEVEITAPSAGSLVRVKSNTAFYFEGTPRRSNFFRTTFQLLRGSLSLKVGRLRSGESYQVQTDNAVMAVRGTDFNVDMALDRSVLVTVPEGRVESTTASGSISSQPGTIAVIENGASARQLNISPEDINLYRQYWQDLRLDALQVNARFSIQQYARQWETDSARLQAAMDELARHRDIFEKWSRIDPDGDNLPSTGDAIRDKREISRGMLALRSSLPPAERTFQTLVGLEAAWQAGYANGPISAGQYQSATAFYRAFSRDKRTMDAMMGNARRYIRIYRVIDAATGQAFESGGIGLMDGMPQL